MNPLDAFNRLAFASFMALANMPTHQEPSRRVLTKDQAKNRTKARNARKAAKQQRRRSK